jgi:hypothetical protein
MSDETPSAAPAKSGNGLLYVALGLFALGLLAIAAIVLTPLLSDSQPGLALYLAAMAAPLGFLMAIVFTLRSGRRAKN